MPIGSTNISMQGIANEKQATQLPAAAQNISLKGLSVDGTNDFQFIGGAFTDIVVAGSSPDQSAPHGMGEFNGYIQGGWGTNTNPTTNLTSIFNQYQENRDGNDTCVVTSCNMILNTSTKVIAYSFSGTEDSGGRSGNIFTTNSGSISYAGTISSLEARFVHVGQAISATGSTNSDPGKIIEMFSNNGHISAADINNNNVLSSIVSTNNNITAGPAGTFRALRTNSGNMSVAIAATADDTGLQDGSDSKIAYSGSDSLTIQLRMNGSTVVNLYQRTGTFDMEAESSEDDTS